MSNELGIALMGYGGLQLLLLPWAVNLKRHFKPWFRDDENARVDFGLRIFLTVSTFVVSVAAIEIGQWLAEFQIFPLAARTAIYVVVAAMHAWRLLRIKAAEFPASV